jgi:hypothetical protein
MASISLAFAGSALLMFAATNVRSDRTNRRPVVTYEGPAADWVVHIAIAGSLFTRFALLAALVSIERKGRLGVLSSAGMLLALIHVFGNWELFVLGGLDRGLNRLVARPAMARKGDAGIV